MSEDRNQELNELCEGCVLNGKQSWSKNPLLTCMWHGGLYLAVHFLTGEEKDALTTHCPDYASADNLKRKRLLKKETTE